jgi:hypothetical protein
MMMASGGLREPVGGGRCIRSAGEVASCSRRPAGGWTTWRDTNTNIRIKHGSVEADLSTLDILLRRSCTSTAARRRSRIPVVRGIDLLLTAVAVHGRRHCLLSSIALVLQSPRKVGLIWLIQFIYAVSKSVGRYFPYRADPENKCPSVRVLLPFFSEIW